MRRKESGLDGTGERPGVVWHQVIVVPFSSGASVNREPNWKGRSMTLTIELTPEQEAALQAQASAAGLDATEYARKLLTSDLAGLPVREPASNQTYSARELLKLPEEEQARYLRAAAELAAPEYEADLALPPHQRELTAISVVAGLDFQDEHAA